MQDKSKSKDDLVIVQGELSKKGMATVSKAKAGASTGKEKKADDITDLKNTRNDFELLRSNYPHWLDRKRLNKKVQNFMGDLNAIVSITSSCEVEVNRRQMVRDAAKKPALTDNERLIEELDVFYEKISGKAKQFLDLERAAAVLARSKRIVISPKNRTNFEDITAYAQSIPMQMLTRGAMICESMIKHGDPNAEAARRILKKCQDAATEYNSLSAVSAKTVTAPKELLPQTVHVFAKLKEVFFEYAKTDKKENDELLDAIDGLLNSYRQKLTLYVRQDLPKIEASQLEVMLSNISVLLYFAKRIDPNYACKSVKGLVVAMEEYADRAKKAVGNIDTELGLTAKKSEDFLKNIQEMFPLSAEEKEEVQLHLKEAKAVETMKHDEVKRYSEELVKKRRGSSSESSSSDAESPKSKTDSSDDKQSKMAELERDRQELAEARRRSDTVMENIRKKELAEIERQAAEANAKMRKAVGKPGVSPRVAVPSKVAALAPAPAASPGPRRPLPPGPKPAEKADETPKTPARPETHKFSRGQ